MRNIRFLITLSLAALLPSCGGGDAARDIHPSEVAYESVLTSGELRERILRSFDRMETPLYQPDSVFWSEAESGGWPGDKEGRTILALTLLQRASGRKAKYLDEIIRRLPEELNEKGYLGTVHEDIDEQQLSGHGWLLRGLCEYYGMTGDTAVLDIAGGMVRNLFLPVGKALGAYPIDPASRAQGKGDMSGSLQNTVDGWRLSSDIGCVFIGMEGVMHYYALRPDPELKTLIDDMMELFLKFDLKGAKAQTHASLTALRGLMRYMDATGDWSLLPEVEKRWQLYRDAGMTANFENFNWFDRFDTWTEPCAVVDSFMLAVQLWKATGNPAYLDEADEIYYNGICHTQRANGGFGCDKPVGPEFDDISVHADEAHWCCTMRGGEGLAKAVQYTYFVKNDTVFVPFFRDGGLNLENEGVFLRQSGAYPFGREVAVGASGEGIGSYKVAVRIPSHIEVNSVRLKEGDSMETPTGRFLVLDGGTLKNNELLIGYSLRKDTEECGADRYRIMEGPLVMALDERGGTVAPLYHLMSPSVSLSEGYQRKVLFHNSEK